MHPLSDGKRRLAKTGMLAAACLVAALFSVGSGAAAPPTGDRIFYTKEKNFLIPFTPEPGSAGIQQVLLYVSDDLGKSYRHHTSTGPTGENFKFAAPGDGWYWFAVQTKDSAGRFFPPNVNLVPPGLKVCVDTVPPLVYVKQVATNEAAAAFEWDVREDNPDLFSLRADYRAVGSRDWVKLEIPPRLSERYFAWNPAVKGPWEVRVQLTDKAGNLGEQTATIASAGTYRPEPMGTGTPPPNPGRASIMVNSLQIHLNYTVDTVGKSKLSTVQIWYTKDDGKTWQLYPKEAPREGGCDVTMAHEGVWGFWVVPVSGVGLSDPPRPGTPPQVTVEIDTTKPVVILRGPPVVGTGADVNKVTIRYQATDKNLAATPIRIQWAIDGDPNGKWTDVAINLPNDGFYVWTVPDEVPAQFHLRVSAIDLAGNVGFKATTELVNVDPVKPKATITDVRVGTPGGTAPPMAPSPPPP